MLVTLLLPTGGTALVAGHDVVREAPAVRRAIGVALQEAALDPLMTGRELMRLQATLHGMPRTESARRADVLLERVGLSQAADRRVGTYSGGMKRRLDLAAALVHEPSVLFLDEPTTGLDPASRITVWDEVRRINAQGTTVFLTTQYLEEADQLCDRIAIIDRGVIVVAGSPSELKVGVGSDVVTIEYGDADAGHVDDLLRELPGLERRVAQPDRLALYVADGTSALAEAIRRLDDMGIVVGGVSVTR